MNFFLWHQFSLAGFFMVLLGISALNLLGLPTLRRRKPAITPKVSVLIPVRDEEENVEECVASALGQDYPDLEVLVYEEGSRDNTRAILSSLSDPKLRVIFGNEPPPGWLGKPWACQKLAEEAQGSLLLFLDADVRLTPKALSSAVALLEREKLDFLSLLPRQEMRSMGEALHVALIPWGLSAFFPLFFRRLRRVAVGQFLLLRREAYMRIGGHEAVRAEVLEDMAMAVRAVRARLRLRLAFGGDLLRCRMYRGFREANVGLAKNLFPLFQKRLLPFIFVWSWLLYVAWQPIFVLFFSLAGTVNPELLVPTAWALGSAGLVWAFTVFRFRLPLWLLVAYPAVHLVAFFTAARSAFWHLSGRGMWKGRTIHVKGGFP